MITRPGYAVEYDFLYPTQLFPSLMTKRIAGPLCRRTDKWNVRATKKPQRRASWPGSTPRCYLQGREPLVLSRADAYIGVLVDDLVTLGTEEPYRLFTSRAEHRLSLMHDTADIRLLPKGHALGLQGDAALDRVARKVRGIEETRELLRRRRVTAFDVARISILESHRGRSFEQALRDPLVSISRLASLDSLLASADGSWLALAEAGVKYEGYIARQEEQVGRFRRMEEKRIPGDFDWDGLTGVSAEAREKLKMIRPISVGQASRISGVRPPDIAVLLVSLTRDGGQARR